jgi:multicomponent Na+:H+ antiporter subunit D
VIEALPPGLLLVFGALVLPLLPRGADGRETIGKVVMLALPVAGFVQVLLLPEGYTLTATLFDYSLEIVRVDRLAKVWGYIFHIAALLSVIYALHVKDRLQHVTALMYAGCAIGAVFAGDLITLFVYWEGTAVTSVFLIWARRTERAYRVGMRYLVIQVASGVLLLAGTVLWVQGPGQGSVLFTQGAFAFDTLAEATPADIVILVAFGIKAAFPFLHNWMQDAYPESTPTGTVWLSAFTTKLAIYALARGYGGTDILIPIGATMTAFPIFYAVIVNDLRKVLAYSLNNQLGFMVVGVGIGTDMALNGTAAHAFSHILYKGLLFMSMGAVMHRVGTTKASELGGLWKSMPKTTFFCIIGAMSISAFPLFSGFISKSLILTAAAEEHYTITFLVLLFASAGVLDHSGIKVPFFAFFAHDSGKRVKEAPTNMLVAMAAAATLCVGLGCFPGPLYDLLPFQVDFNPYTTTHVVTQLQLLLASTCAFVFLNKVGWYPHEIPSLNVDFDWTYRKALPAAAGFVRRVGGGVWSSFTAGAVGMIQRGLTWIGGHAGPGGRLGEPWPTGATVFWAALLLAAYLVLGFL